VLLNVQKDFAHDQPQRVALGRSCFGGSAAAGTIHGVRLTRWSKHCHISPHAGHVALGSLGVHQTLPDPGVDVSYVLEEMLCVTVC
jgi:hypothetical protein